MIGSSIHDLGLVNHSNHFLSTILLEFPISIVKRADLSGFEPSRNAVEMEGMLPRTSVMSNTLDRCVAYVADSPRDSAFFSDGSALVGLTFNALNHG